MADRKITDLTALTTPASADVLPIVDVSEAAAADKNKKVTVGELFKGIPDGTAAAPAIAFESDDGNGFFLSTTDTIGIATNGVSRATVSTTAVTSTLPISATAFSPTSATVPTNGVYLPATNSVGIATNGSVALTIDSSQRLGVGTTSPTEELEISSATPAMKLSDTDEAGSYGTVSMSSSVMYLQSNGAATNGQLIYRSGNAGTFTERLRIDSSGRVGIGTSNPGQLVQIGEGDTGVGTNVHTIARIEGRAVAGGQQVATLEFNQITNAPGEFVGASIGIESSAGTRSESELVFKVSQAANTNATEAMRLSHDGRLGIGTTSPGTALDVAEGARAKYIQILNNGYAGTFATTPELFSPASATLAIGAGGSERLRIDSSGRLLVGTSTARSVGAVGNHAVQIEGASYSTASFSIVNNEASSQPAYLTLGKSRGGSLGSNVIVNNGDVIGSIDFAAADGTDIAHNAARIRAIVDGTPGVNDLPGALTFSTTADGASSPTERMRITNAGYLFVGKTSSDINVAGFQVYGPTGQTDVTVSGSECMNLNRNTSDGDIVRFRQDNNVEGSISVSGTTISYNGAHLSRWSQLPGGVERTEILRGTVLSNIDEMCEWGEEENEQLNRMKVSDVEGDKNVSGVFQSWDDDDDTYTNDFYCAMTGDFIIRIGAGVTVERGDLLMSAGDGTAKPQDDDIIRSKTIAKVTSTNVSCTYEDGSYCVPCVLMAC